MAKQSNPTPRVNGPDFEKLVADALEHLWEFSYLGKSPVANLTMVKQSLPQGRKWSHVDLGRALSRVLQEAIENLKPAEHHPSFSRESLYYPILRQAYIEGIENKVIVHNLGISRRTFYRRRTEAIGVIAQILRDWEVQRTS
jgi:hypothetical protein